MAYLVRLSGEHRELPLAELQALLGVHAPDAVATGAPVAVIDPGTRSRQQIEIALQRQALAHAYAESWGRATGVPEAATLVERLQGAGTVAVRAGRIGDNRFHSTRELERTLGAALARAGHVVDLDHPDHVIVAWVHDHDIYVGRLLAHIDRSAYDARAVEAREHFSPIALHPRRAASLVHLARAPPGGRVHDPFCGTGSIVLEAALDGYVASGSDIDPHMVQGTYQALTDAGPQALAADVFEADIGDVAAMTGRVDAIVTDLPYGRAATTRREDVASLYGRSFAAFADLLEPGARAVVGASDLGLLQRITEADFRVEANFEEFVHRSLTRHFVVARRV